MRKCNAILGMGITALFAVHAIAGTFQLSGIIPGGSSLMKILAYVLMILIALHVIIGIILTIRSVRTALKAGAFYFRDNKLFWTRRLSGFALMLFIADHLLVFSNGNRAVIRLSFFGNFQLAMSILLVLALAIHILTCVRPALTGFGFEGRKGRAADLAFVLTVVLLLCAVAFFIYYLRWLP